MKKITAIIERGSDGLYGIYVKDDIEYGINGVGKNVKEAMDDFYGAYEDIRESYIEDNEVFPEYEFDFEYDLPSFLNHYSKIFSYAGLERITGINQKQLQHYVSGYRKPRPAMVKKIEESIHNLGRELDQVKFA